MAINNYNSHDEEVSLDGKVQENVSEQYQERAKKAQIQLKKIQKDEKFAKGDNQKLFLILTRFIQDPYYFSLISDVTALLSAGFPSRSVISMISLFYPDAAFYILENLQKKDHLQILLSLPKNPEIQIFDEKNTHPNIKKWMSEWIAFSESFLVQSDSSVLMVRKFFSMISGEHGVLFEKIVTNFIIFFFRTRNIQISQEIAVNYARFIIKNMIQNLSKFLESQSQQVQELIADAELTADNLFGS